jgi:micrococcal nuclease
MYSIRRRAFALVAVAYALLVCPTVSLAQRVERVIDGDTVMIAGVGTVRFIGVDTPETVDPRESVQYFGRVSSAFLQGLIAGTIVRLEYDQQRRDKYGRTLAYLYLADGTFVNAEIVRQGYGHAYTDYPFRYLEAFRGYEREARTTNRGLWATAPAAVVAAPTQVDPKTTVYVTRTGNRYHAADCRFLARSQIPMPLEQAATRYGACAVCRPPTRHAGSPPAKADPAPSSSPSPSVSSGRCQAITQKGTQCSRRAQSGSQYCWQHSR